MDSHTFSTSPSTTQPDSTANTDSKLISREAVEGSTCFCPTICKVNAIPLERIPA